MQHRNYGMARGGLATEFSQAAQPLDYSRGFTNRFINLLGGAEKRPGIEVIGGGYDIQPDRINAGHEHVDDAGIATLYCSGVDVSGNGRIWRFDVTASSWFAINNQITPVNTTLSTNRLRSVNMGGKIIFVNGHNRNFYVDYDRQTSNYSLKELQPIIELGTLGTGTSANRAIDSQVSNWLDSTYVRVNDVLYNKTLNAYALITAVGSALSTTRIDVSAAGLGSASRTMDSGDYYEIYDTVALNIIPTTGGLDNTAVAGTGTNGNTIAVSGVNFTQTEALAGDYVYNSTKATLLRVEADPSAVMTVTSAVNTSAGDSLVFLKKAMPVANNAHVHYDRLYLVDSRRPTRVVVSGPLDPQDFTTSQLTLEASSIDYASKQPEAEEILTLGTFQRFLVAGGKRNVYVDQGVDAVADTSAVSIDLDPVALFPQGCVSKDGFVSIGHNAFIASDDGLRSFRVSDVLAVETNNVSEQIKSELRSAIKAKSATDGEVQLVHYPRRNWVLFKVGNVVYNLNYTGGISGDTQTQGWSWTKFTGRLPECDGFMLRSNGDLICAGGTKVYKFDSGKYSDDGDPIKTVYKTGWSNQSDVAPGESVIKDGRYIRPYFETNSKTVYTIKVATDFSEVAVDEIIVTAAGAGAIGSFIVGESVVGQPSVFSDMQPLRWRGDHVAFTFTSESSGGPDSITKFTVFGNTFGRG